MLKKNLKKLITDFHSFTRGERNGIMIILLLILISGIFRLVYPKWSHNRSVEPVSIENTNLQSESIIENKTQPHVYPDTLQNTKVPNTEKVKRHKIIELNTADSVQLTSLPGIGPVLSSRIIKYRNLLGGFQNKKQLNEVFGLKREHIAQFISFVKIDTAQVIKILLNSDSFKEINKHPYITFEQTKAIFKFRNRNIYITKDLLIQQNIFDTIELKKLIPYLQF